MQEQWTLDCDPIPVHRTGRALIRTGTMPVPSCTFSFAVPGGSDYHCTVLSSPFFMPHIKPAPSNRHVAMQCSAVHFSRPGVNFLRPFVAHGAAPSPRTLICLALACSSSEHNLQLLLARSNGIAPSYHSPDSPALLLSEESPVLQHGDLERSNCNAGQLQTLFLLRLPSPHSNYPHGRTKHKASSRVFLNRVAR